MRADLKAADIRRIPRSEHHDFIFASVRVALSSGSFLAYSAGKLVPRFVRVSNMEGITAQRQAELAEFEDLFARLREFGVDVS